MPLQGRGEESIGKTQKQSEGPLSLFGLRGRGPRSEGKRGRVGMRGMKAAPGLSAEV